MNKILVVDSSPQNTDLVSQCLRTQEYETFTAESGYNALAKIKLHKPDLIIIDVDLFDMSGYDICKTIKSDPAASNTVVLLVSARDTKDFRLRATEVDADDFMEKNFDSATLITKTKTLLRLKVLSDQLKQKYIELEDKNKMMDIQIQMSRQVQRSLIPDIDIEFNGLTFYSSYIPVMEIGGDFYDVFELNAHCYAVAMGDVSGHGIAAALLTSMLKMMMQNLAAKYFNPDQFLFFMNKEFYKALNNIKNEMYACIFYAVIDTQKAEIYYSNSGLALPVFVDSKNNKVFELVSNGTPIGMMENVSYQFNRQSYNKGDLVLFHTDGLADVFYKDNPQEFMKNMERLLLDVKSESPKAIAEFVLSEFYNYNATDSEKLALDDVSVIICKM
ncbi:MAG: fused response regulator/phosphatase [Clostridiales bacterium]|jgi:sigma-B regulation protein RsbU (phosphoserine phosphatase)|nr:fused response regulator/phosphatase [Clostridiales bacterium]